jgi:hypothetical protein
MQLGTIRITQGSEEANVMMCIMVYSILAPVGGEGDGGRYIHHSLGYPLSAFCRTAALFIKLRNNAVRGFMGIPDDEPAQPPDRPEHAGNQHRSSRDHAYRVRVGGDQYGCAARASAEGRQPADIAE